MLPARLALLSLVFVSGCVVPRTAAELAERERPQTVRVHTDLIRGMLDREQYFAALAHIEEVERSGSTDVDELRLLRANTLYRIGRLSDAVLEYQALLDGPWAGEALHGLGLIYVKSDLARAVSHFNAAVRKRPTDAELRNDLGYALMMAGRLPEARHHLSTAAELDPGGVQASNNLILSYLVAGDESTATALARSAGLDEAGMQQLRREVSILRRVIRTRASEFGSNPQG